MDAGKRDTGDFRPVARELYQYILDHADRDRRFVEKDRETAAALGMSRRSIVRARRELLQVGLIEVAKAGGGRERATVVRLPAERAEATSKEPVEGKIGSKAERPISLEQQLLSLWSEAIREVPNILHWWRERRARERARVSGDQAQTARAPQQADCRSVSFSVEEELDAGCIPDSLRLRFPAATKYYRLSPHAALAVLPNGDQGIIALDQE